MNKLKRFFIRKITLSVLYVFNFVSSFFKFKSLYNGTMSPKIGYFLCAVFSPSRLMGLIYPIFFDENLKSAIKLQIPKTYEGLGSKYRLALLGVDNSLLGKTISWRNNRTYNERKILLNKNKLNYDDANILFVTRSWHFCNQLFDEIKKVHNKVYKFDINNYDSMYLFTNLKNVNKNRVFRDITFSSLKNTVENNSIKNFEHLAKLSKEDIENIEASDMVFIDWLNHNTIWAINNLPMSKRIIVRVHSYEVFSYFPLMINFGRIDGLIFISEGIKEAFYELWGWIIPVHIQSIVLQNIRSKSRLNKSENFDQFSNKRKKTLGMLQYAVDVKDLGFALDTFELIYNQDNEYRLVLAGDKLNKDDEYQKVLLERIDRFPKDTIQELGYIKEVNTFFERVGFMLSTSIREGSHESLIEGMLFGCIPVIRDWPLISPFNGAKSSFPQFETFITQEEMAKYILSSYDNFNSKSDEALKHSQYYFDENMSKKYLEFIVKVGFDEKNKNILSA